MSTSPHIVTSGTSGDSATEQRPDPAIETTRGRILCAGMACFAREGFAGATTRMIASAAGVTLPVIAYHFGNKDGLHLACAEEIVDQHRRLLLPVVAAARTAADEGALDATQARAWLERILATLIGAITADPAQRLTTDFVLREMSEQGPGYRLLYDELWMPGIGLVADLLALARGVGQTGGTCGTISGESDRIGALMLLASLSAFTREEPIARAFLGWDPLDAGHRARIVMVANQLLSGLIAA